MKKYIAILLLFSPLLILAQSNYKPGYIVNIKGDTIKGFVDYKEWGQNPKQISFKKGAESDKVQQLGVADISAFAIDKFEYYQRATVQISRDYTDLSNTTVGPRFKFKTDSVFLLILQKGKNISLFAYTDEIKKRYYIAESDKAPEELAYRVYYDPSNVDALIKANLFAEQLQALANKYNISSPTIKNLIVTANYSEKDLVNVINKINSNVPEVIPSSKKAHYVRLFIGAEINTNTFNYSNYVFAGTSSTSVSPAIFGGFDVFFNPNIGKLLIRVEVGITTNSFSFASTDLSLSPQRSFYSQNIKENNVWFSPQVLYNVYNTNAFKVFVGGGGVLNFTAYPTNQFTNTSDNGPGTAQTTTIKNGLFVQYVWVGFNAKAGVVINKKIEIFGQYSPAVENTDFIKGTQSSYSFGASYLFGKTK